MSNHSTCYAIRQNKCMVETKTKEAIDTELSGKQDLLSTATVTLTSSGWSDKTQTVSIEGITADNIVWVSPAPSTHTAYTEANIRATAQAEGSLTFTCDEVPSSNVVAQVVFT